jgi:hypothetical protein
MLFTSTLLGWNVLKSLCFRVITSTSIYTYQIITLLKLRSLIPPPPPLMSRLVCSWVDLAGDQDTESWYLNKHIPSVAESLNTTVRNGERAASEAARDMFKEVVGIDGQYMTIYNLSEKTNAQNIDAQTKAASSKLPKDAKIDMRIYEEYAKMHGEEWSDSKATFVQASICMR